MVFFAPFIGAAAIYAGFASAAPTPDSAIGDEVAVSAPYGYPESATPQQLYGSATDTGSYSQSTGSSYGSGDSYDSGSSYSSGSYDSSNYSPPQEQQQYQPSYTSSSTWSSATSSATSTWSSPSYGSGSSNWGGSGYDSCVSQCVASYGAPPAAYTPSSTSGGSYGSSGSGATHTVIVAPTQGVLRYIPFALNASVGDTVLFMWGANNHTVTKSSMLEPCNKTSDAPFASGTQNKPFSFTQTVNSTDPVFFYCGTPGHCPKGMFGIINPPSQYNGQSSVSTMLPSMAANDSTMAAMSSYSDMLTSNNTAASDWGNNIDMSAMPAWSQSLVAQNVLYTRAFLGQNADVLGADSSVNLTNAGSNPLMIPQDISNAINNAGSTTSAASSTAVPAAATAAAASTTPSSSASPASGLKSNSAGFLTSPRALVAVMAVAVTFLSL